MIPAPIDATAAGSAEGLAWCQALGAERVVSSCSGDVDQEMTRLAPVGMDVCWDTSGKPSFTVQDGVLRVSGQKAGYLATEKEYESYVLSVEYRWGEKTGGRRSATARESGIVVHAQGNDGFSEATGVSGYECLLGDGLSGALKLHRGGGPPIALTATVDPVKAKASPRQLQYLANGMETQVTTSLVIQAGSYDPDRQAGKGFQGKQDLETLPGEWNQLKIVCGPSILVVLNGTLVNAGRQPSVNKGKILFRSRAAEIFFRKIQVWALKP